MVESVRAPRRSTRPPSLGPPPDLGEARLGTVLAGKWRLERVLGAGGMATVYAASHRNNLRRVAIKVLHPELAANPDLRKRFLREGYIANKVAHPSVVQVLDDGEDEDDKSVFLVMDLLSGVSLYDAQVRAGGALSPKEALRIAGEVLEVLVAAHAQGIVHRDLKPDNVFLTDDGAVKVLDFGIARLVDARGGDRATQTGVTIGTPAYMPPEQARGRTNEVGERSDVWAVGAILFTVLTGRHVHEGETPNEVLLKAMTTPAPGLATFLPGAPLAVVALVDRALSFEQDDRWPNAQAMRDALSAAEEEVRHFAEGDVGLGSATTAVARSIPLPPEITGRAARAASAERTPPSSSSESTQAGAPIVRDVNAPRKKRSPLVAVASVLGIAAGVAVALFVRAEHRPVLVMADLAQAMPAAAAAPNAPEGEAVSTLADAGAAVPLPAAGVDLTTADAADAGDDADEDDDDDELGDAGVHPMAHGSHGVGAKRPAHPRKKGHKKKRR